MMTVKLLHCLNTTRNVSLCGRPAQQPAAYLVGNVSLYQRAGRGSAPQGRRSLTSISLIIICFFSMLWLSACGGPSKNQKEIQAYIDEVKSAPPSNVEPLPPPAKYVPYKYAASGLRSPFSPPQITVRRGNGVQPDINRPKQELEKYPLDGLRMVGTLAKNNRIWGLLVAPDGVVYRVQAGNYVGQNYGRITNITKDKIEVTETVPDGLGGWKPRKVAITLAQ